MAPIIETMTPYLRSVILAIPKMSVKSTSAVVAVVVSVASVDESAMGMTRSW